MLLDEQFLTTGEVLLLSERVETKLSEIKKRVTAAPLASLERGAYKQEAIYRSTIIVRFLGL